MHGRGKGLEKIRASSKIRILLSAFWATSAMAAWSAAEQFGSNALVVVSLFVVSSALLTLSLMHGPWSSTFLAALVLAVFHFAAFPSVLQGRYVGEAARVIFYSPDSGPGAMLLSVSGLSAFVSGALIFKRRTSIEGPGGANSSGARIGRVAALLTILLIFIWISLALVQTGTNPFGVSYLEFLDRAQSSAWVLQPLGLVFAWSAMARGRLYWSAVTCFAAWGFMAFFIGLRGEVLFAVVAHAAVLAASRRMPKFKWIVPLIVLTLVAASFGRQVRDEGLANYEFHPEDVGITKAMAELGFSQYVVETTYRWHQINNEPHYSGSTYTAPVERMAARLLGLDVVDGVSDYRLMNSEIIAREGQIGGSVIAEAFHNFGSPGVPGILWLWGFAISFCRSKASWRNHRMLAFEGLLLFLFLWHVRNSFVPLPVQFAYGTGMIFLLTKRISALSSNADSDSGRALVR